MEELCSSSSLSDRCMPRAGSTLESKILRPMSLSTCIQMAEAQCQKRPFATVWDGCCSVSSEVSCLCVFFLFIISRFTRKSFEMHLFYREKENLSGMKFLRLPKSHCAVVQRFLGAFPWPPCRGQACLPSRPLLLPAMLFWVNTIWGVWFFISL